MLQKYHSQLYNEKVRKSKISKYISFEYLQQLEKLRNKWKMFMGNNKELYETHLKAYDCYFVYSDYECFTLLVYPVNSYR